MSTLVHRKREYFQADVVYMNGSKENNDGFKFCLAVIDCFTKYSFIFPLKRISSERVIHHLRTLFSNAGNIPELLQHHRYNYIQVLIGEAFFNICTYICVLTDFVFQRA